MKERVRRSEEENAKLRERERERERVYLFQFWMFEALRMNAKLKEDISQAPGWKGERNNKKIIAEKVYN